MGPQNRAEEGRWKNRPTTTMRSFSVLYGTVSGSVLKNGPGNADPHQRWVTRFPVVTPTFPKVIFREDRKSQSPVPKGKNRGRPQFNSLSLDIVTTRRVLSASLESFLPDSLRRKMVSRPRARGAPEPHIAVPNFRR
jgi:hypothetical protein